MKNLKSIGQIVLGIVIFLGIIFIAYFFIFGSTYVAVKLNPFLIRVTSILTIISIFILFPLTIFKKTRSFSAITLYVFSYIFGLSAWVFALITTLLTFGTIGVIIGLVLFGGGIIPVGLLGAMIHGEWGLFGSLIYIIALTYGIRLFVTYLANKEANNIQEVEVIEDENIEDNSSENSYSLFSDN